MSENLSSAAVVIGALRVKYRYTFVKYFIRHTLCKLSNFNTFLLSADFFSKNSFRNTIRVAFSVKKSGFRPGPDKIHFVGLIWVQIVCKDYQQTT